ncbi:unnamed protein product [Urochloa humidicola]
MANFAIDPRPFIPIGFEWQPRNAPREPRRMRVFLGPSGVKTNEHLAIAITEPHVASEDFHVMAHSLQTFLQNEHQVRELEIWHCPIGEAYVRFGCPLERTRFLKSPLQFGQYQLRFIKHDEGANARMTDLDREAWLMLLCYPNDYRSDVEIEKALAGFAVLRHIHRSSNVARVVVKVMINKEDDVPDEIVVSPGDSPRAPSWTIPVFILYATDPAVLADEDALPPFGALHPLPQPAPRWMEGHGLDGQSQNVSHGDASVGFTPNTDIADAVPNQSEPLEEGMEEHQVQSTPAPAGNQGQLGNESPFSGASADFAALGGLKSPMMPQATVPLKVVEDEPMESEPRVIERLSGVEVLNKMPARKTPKKRRARKVKGPLDAGLLRRSLRLKKVHGYKDDASAAAAGISAKPVEQPAAAAVTEAVDDHAADPEPLEVVDAGALVPYGGSVVDPTAAAAPHLTSSLAGAIGVQFLKMPPGAVSDDVLMAASDDE